MSGGDSCPICTSATKYQYIMEELVKKVTELDEKIDKQYIDLYNRLDDRDEKFREQLKLIAESCNQKAESQSKGIVEIIIGLLGIALGAILSWGLGLT